MREMGRLCACAAVLLVTVMAVSGCRASRGTPRYYEYLNQEGNLALSGEVNGVGVEATLRFAARDGGGAVQLPDYALTYTSPAALAGVSVRYEAATGERTVSLGEMQRQTEECGLDDIAEAIVCERAVRTATHQGEALVLTLDDGTVLTLNAQTGQPTAIARASGDTTFRLQIRAAEE